MSKILGLDLGTNSIGWAVIENDREETSLLNKGVHIFSEGVKIEKGIESSKAAERSKYRSARRIKFRRKLRKLETLETLIKYKMCPLPIEELIEWKKDKKAYPKNPEFSKWLKTNEQDIINPYFFRSKASKEKIGLFELGRAFYHLAQRRGFLSNRLDQGDDGIIEQVRQEFLQLIETAENKEELLPNFSNIIEGYKEEEDKAVKKLLKSIDKVVSENKLKPFEELKESLLKVINKAENLGVVKGGIAKLSKEIADAKCETLGQYFYLLNQKNEKIRTHYTSREEHYKHEFNVICKVQGLSNEIIAELENAIFYFRPLKSQKGLIGKCTFEKDKPRCPVSHPAYEEYRALQFINSIKIGLTEKGEKDFLDDEQRKKIWSKFIRKSKPNFDFEDIAKELTPKNETRYFNYKNNVAVSGCPTIAQLANVFGEDWEQNIFGNYTKTGKKSVYEVVNDIWHVLFTFDKSEKLQEFAKTNLGLNDVKAKKFSLITLRKDYGSLSLKAINKILPYLHQGLIYSYAVFLANIEKVVGKEIWSSPENQEVIKKALKELIDDYNEIKKREGIVNDLMGQFKHHYNNSDKDYVLDKIDKKDIEEKTISACGNKAFEKLDAAQQQEIFNWIESTYLTQLRKYRGEFIKSQRLDEKIAAFLKDNFNVTQEATELLYHPSDIEQFKTPKRAVDGNLYLGSPVTGSIKNPMAIRAMHQLRKLVNTLISEGKIDEETKIHIELARELNDANKRKAIQDWQKEREEARAKYKEEIKKLYKEECGKDIEPSEDETLKYQLWKEQGDVCLYTGKQIGICDFIGGNPLYDIEHTIPKSLSYDNSQVNLTLCENKFNRDVKKNRIPFELENHKEILLRLSKWEKNIEEYDWKYNSRKKARGIETKEQKDKRIREKHYFKLHLDYWKGKCNRFTREDVPSGFKNSQLVDTGIITKYSRAYLKSIFQSVYSVKGDAVAEFRKLWGLQQEYSKKARVNHIHHCIDAITIACMTKDKYDMLAKLYHADEENRTNEKKELLKTLKPWATFTEDVKAIEQEVLISHHTPDNMKKQTKKKLRIRGKVQYENGKPIYQQGDTVRGSLHKETFYGAIIQPNQTLDITPKYVVRKSVESLTASDISNIVDLKIKSIVSENVKLNGLKQASKDGFFMESGVPIKKVRCYAPTITSPIFLKSQRDKSRFEHKQNYHVANDGNYLMAIYEGKNNKGVIKRNYNILNVLEAGEHLKLSKRDLNIIEPIKQIGKEKSLINIPLKSVIKKGTMVLFYKKKPEEIWDLNTSELNMRLYKIVKFDKSGRIYFRHHTEARPATELKEVYKVDFENVCDQICLMVSAFDAIVQGVDFTLSSTGNVQKIN
ncbi:MAG: type II CRISPR RNA-guided endonuclease Cas9 [Bacteroidia bacterium]